MNKLQKLIQEGKILQSSISYVEPPYGVMRLYAVYKINDEANYYVWLNSAKVFLDKYFTKNRLVNEFYELSKDITPKSHVKMVSILESFLDDYVEEPDSKQDLQTLEEYETVYKNLTLGNRINATETISKFHEWYNFAIKVFFNYVGEHDSSFQKFKNVDASGNGYSLSNVFDSIQSDYVVLKEKVRKYNIRTQWARNPITLNRVSNINKMDKNKIFISYSHQDKKYLERLLTHIKVLKRWNNNYEVWSDKNIRAGDNWKLEIEKALDETSIALLLVSTDFLASDFVMNDELPKILQRSRDEGTLVIPIILSHCMFEESNLSLFQAANNPQEPLSNLSDAEVDKVFVDLLRQLNK